jgi:hypothetical protein
VAVIAVPHAACPPYRLWKAYLQLRRRWPYGTEIPYTKRELRRLARKAGFVQTRLTCSGFLQSVGTHLCKEFLHRRPEWTDHPCRLDDALGLNLLLIAKTEGTCGGGAT